MSSESDISYLGPKLLPQKTPSDFLSEAPSCFVSRVELLQRLGRLLFHFIPENISENDQKGQNCDNSIFLDQTISKINIDVRISTSGRKIVLSELTQNSSIIGKINSKRNIKKQFVLDLPFPIRATAMRDNYNSEKTPLGHRIITISFDRISKSDSDVCFKEPKFNEEIEELNDKINSLWDASYFLEVKNIICGGCQLDILSPIIENFSGEISSSNSSSPNTEKASDEYSEKDLTSVLSFNDGIDISEPKEKNLSQEIKETIEKLKQLDFATEKITNSLKTPSSDSSNTLKNNVPYQTQAIDVQTKLFDRVRNLPSEGWEELVDCWVCHSEDYTPQFSKLFHPSPTTLLVGATYILIHPSRLASYLKPQLTKGIPPPSSRLVCPACNTLLGEILADAQSLTSVEGIPSNPGFTSSTQLVVKLNKFSLLTNKVLKEKDTSIDQAPKFELKSLPVAAMLLSDLIGKYRFQSATRFILEDQDTNKAKTLIMVLNWEVYLWDNSIEASSADPSVLTPAVRLCYLDLTPPKPPLIHSTEASLKYRLDNRHIIAQNWALDESIAILSYPAEYIRQILESFTLILPGLGSAHPLAGPLFQDGYLYLPTNQP